MILMLGGKNAPYASPTLIDTENICMTKHDLLNYIRTIIQRVLARQKGNGSYAKSIITIDMYKCLSVSVNRKLFHTHTQYTHIHTRVEAEGQR